MVASASVSAPVSAPAPASAPAAAPAAAGKSLMIRSVQAEASSAEVQARSDDSRLEFISTTSMPTWRLLAPTSQDDSDK